LLVTGLSAFIRTLTSLPVDVAITHGNRDHFGQVDKFKESNVYMSEKDKSRLPAELITPKFKWVKEGDKIDIGNGRSYEILEILPGDLQ
jgi:glyoxylase-like metal-dependent hydrolase (beta-lactamase superfamily II)